MPSHMSVQKIATKRNSLAEMLIDYILQKFSEKLYNEGYIKEEAIPEQQKSFSRNDCSEVYDHYIELHFSNKIDRQERTFEIWAQTTCYKGNVTGKPESNKTYEIRETLVEALTLRKWLIEEKKNFRTIHFTLGPSNYTYGWFMPAKENAFDLSLYPKYTQGEDLFDAIIELGKDAVYQFDFYEKLDTLMEENSHPLCTFISNTINALIDYFIAGFPTSEMANKQAVLLKEIQESSSELMDYIVKSSQNAGMDIKGKSVKLLSGEDIVDPILGKTLKKLIQTNPFLPIALDALTTWDSWSKSTFSRTTLTNNLPDYVYDLWSDTSDNRYVTHRLLMRIYTENSINYIQDLSIDGVDEHNLYNENHTPEQISQIVTYLCEKYIEHGITTPTALYDKLTSNQAKALVNSSLKFERINGTSLKPSFYYLEEYIAPKYELVSFEDASLAAPIAYYSKFAEDLNVKAYGNLKVIHNTDTKKNLAIVKGKFFRQPEFPRRVKEESYVGLTAKYDLIDNTFVEKYPNLPFIMFIDMAQNYTPPAFAIRRLINYGWIPFFQLNKLMAYLNKLNGDDEI